MIKFPCKCGHIFNLPDDMAGGLTQCPRCGLLADVPSLNDLANMGEDGTINLADHVPLEEIRIAEVHQAFTNQSTDKFGNEYDLRNSSDRVEQIRTMEEIEPRRVTPKYDPYTGELIRPLDVKEDEPLPVLIEIDVPRAVIPISATPVQPIAPAKSLGYALGHTRKSVNALSIFLELFMAPNAIVMSVLFILYAGAMFLVPFLVVGSAFVGFSLQVLNFPICIILAHYGIVVEEMGPENRDELPRPLRDLGLYEDLWNPLTNVVQAGLICFAPAVLGLAPWLALGASRPAVFLLCFLLGCFYFPAVLLTACTSGTLINLRPDRVLGVVAKCGLAYFVSVFTFVLSLLPVFYFPIGHRLLSAYPDKAWIAKLTTYTGMLPLAAVAVYFGHYFCWHLGLLYRDHHDQFPWVMQRHISKREPVQRSRRTY